MRFFKRTFTGAAITLGALLASAAAHSKTIELIASDAAKYDELGHAVAINERFTIASAKLDDNGSSMAVRFMSTKKVARVSG